MRDRLGLRLREHRPTILVEVSLVILLKLFAALASVSFLLLGSLSLWLRRSGWRMIGMRKPGSWRRTVLAGAGAGAIYQLLSIGVLIPALERLTDTKLDLGKFDSVRGNAGMLALWLLISWTLAAFGEEMAYRGYALNRIADLLRNRPIGWALGAILSSVLFGFGHSYQGTAGAFEAFVTGAVCSCLYLASKRNLWLPIVFHGASNTFGLLLIYFDLYR